jgi:hypothetical protein
VEREGSSDITDITNCMPPNIAFHVFTTIKLIYLGRTISEQLFFSLFSEI